MVIPDPYSYYLGIALIVYAAWLHFIKEKPSETFSMSGKDVVSYVRTGSALGRNAYYKGHEDEALISLLNENSPPFAFLLENIEPYGRYFSDKPAFYIEGDRVCAKSHGTTFDPVFFDERQIKAIFPPAYSGTNS